LSSRKKTSERPSTLPEQSAEANAGTLYVVATPIGNLEDITLRALRILKEVSLIAAEDTRHTRKLLAHYGIGTPLVSYYREKEAERGQEIISHLLAGRDVALVSDAGTPGISDPGAVLVELCRRWDIRIVPVPGPSAPMALLSVAGRSFAPFLFLGFLPSRASQRRKFLASVAAVPQALVFFESPRRALRCLEDCLELLGNRQALLARELTKVHEEIRQESLSDLVALFAARETVKGELVLAVEGAGEQPAVSGGDLRKILTSYHQDSKLSLRDAVKQVAGEMGLSRSAVYQEALKIWKKG
jgi:16S rRNA (cytidine1402-2'-O)-methyltransferase